MKSNDPRVVAIRADKVVGLGSCSSVDECYSDEEVVETLNEMKVTSVADAVKWARRTEGLHLEQACNARWGEDDDAEPKALRDFERNCRED
jgi:hypothetical protein